LRAVDFDEDFRPLDFPELFRPDGRRALDFALRELLLAAREERAFAETFDPLDFLAPEDLDPARFLSPEVLTLLDDFRPRDAEDFLALAEPRRAPLFLLDDDFLEAIPAARFAAPTAWVAAALAVATFLGLPAALPAIAPINPPTTVPTGPATLPTTAPAAAPAVVLEIDGTSRLSEEEGLFSDDC
jgi:hypothetical protein